jgi:glycosyltransferase involved in cell wall biosynthesis
MLSVIIPTYNEEKRLPKMLATLKKEKSVDFEIIVADRPGHDKTREIAKSWGCKITDGGSPAEGRNMGADIAEGDMLLFLDADIKLSPHFLRNSIREFNSRKLGIASYHLYPVKGNFLINSLSINVYYNWQQTLLRNIFPMGAMGIMVKKDIFKSVGGFDYTIKLAEDVNFVREAAKLGKFGIIKSARIFMSLRRFDKDGYLRTGLKYFLCEAHMMLKGPVRSGKTFDYQFGHFDENKLKK